MLRLSAIIAVLLQALPVQGLAMATESCLDRDESTATLTAPRTLAASSQNVPGPKLSPPQDLSPQSSREAQDCCVDACCCNDCDCVETPEQRPLREPSAPITPRQQQDLAGVIAPRMARTLPSVPREGRKKDPFRGCREERAATLPWGRARHSTFCVWTP